MLKRERTQNSTGLHTPPEILGLMLVVIFATQSLPAAKAQSRYSITDLGTLGGDRSDALSINKLGDVVGESGVPSSIGIFHAFLYKGGKMRDLGTLDGPTSDALGVNDSSSVVGQSSLLNVNGESQQAFLYSGGKMRNLTPGTNSGAWGINNLGQISGYFYVNLYTGFYHAFLYSSGQLRDLGTLGGDYSSGTGINDRGQVVGRSNTAGNRADHAFLYSAGQMQDLGAFEPNSAYNRSVALRINEHGQVVGYAFLQNDSGPYHAFLYTSGQIQDLGTLPGSVSSEGDDINNLGAVVGGCIDINNVYTVAFLYVGGQMRDLNTLLVPNSGWVLSRATGINDSGQVAATGTRNGKTHALLLTPVK